MELTPAEEAATPASTREQELESLADDIGHGLSVARNLDREGLADVIAHLRRARNHLVWLLGAQERVTAPVEVPGHMPGRTLALGDIHGCSRALARLIEVIKPGPQATLVPLGDYINRVPNSPGVLGQLLALQERCRLVPQLGS